MNKLEHQTIDLVSVRDSQTIRSALEVISKNRLMGVFVVDQMGVLIGSLTDGDIRFGLLKGLDIEISVRSVMNPKPIMAGKSLGLDAIYKLMTQHSILMLPQVDEEGVLVDYYHFFEISEHLFTNPHQVAVGPKPLTKPDPQVVNLVTVIGGAGYIGSVLVRQLLEAGMTVRVLDSLLYGEDSIKELNKNDQFELVRGDVRDTEALVDALKGADAVVHLGEIVGDPACAVNDSFTLDVNFLATKNITEICVLHGISRLIFASSCSVYGVGEEKLDEESPLNPVSLYAQCKIQSEEVILSFYNRQSFFPTILRLATVFGASFRPRFDLVVNLLTAKAIIDGEITIHGGDQWRPFISAQDVARAIMVCLSKPVGVVGGEIFNTGDQDLNYQIMDVGKAINARFADAKLAVSENAEDRRNYFVDFSKIEKLLGFRCRTDLERGVVEIRDMILQRGIRNYQERQFHNLLTLR